MAGHDDRDGNGSFWHELGGQAPAPEPAQQPDPLAPRHDPTPPTPGYLNARAELGMPSATTVPGLLDAACPWCHQGPHQPCVNPATLQRKPRAHDARYQAAGLDVPAVPAHADLAREQAEEARARRVVSLLP